MKCFELGTAHSDKETRRFFSIGLNHMRGAFMS